MQIETLEKVIKAAKDLDVEIDLRPNYSGRGMFGSTTHAFAASEFGVKSIEERLNKQFFKDSMGKDIIAY